MTKRTRQEHVSDVKEAVELARDLAGQLKALEARGVSLIPVVPVPLEVSETKVEDVAPIEVVAEVETVTRAPRNLGKEARLKHLQDQAEKCRRCKLAGGRKRVVFGVGSASARVMFIGEGPGAEEDRTGIPFVGRAGKLLTCMLEAIGVKRDDVYIANIVKCRPPGNRDPHPDEVGACRAFLEAQLEAIGPEVVVAIGRPAAQSLLGTTAPLGKLRGSLHRFRDRDLLVTYHPAYLLRNPVKKQESWADLCHLADMLVARGALSPTAGKWWEK
jgi:uracil-DNA glycosylase